VAFRFTKLLRTGRGCCLAGLFLISPLVAKVQMGCSRFSIESTWVPLAFFRVNGSVVCRSHPLPNKKGHDFLRRIGLQFHTLGTGATAINISPGGTYQLFPWFPAHGHTNFPLLMSTRSFSQLDMRPSGRETFTFHKPPGVSMPYAVASLERQPQWSAMQPVPGR